MPDIRKLIRFDGELYAALQKQAKAEGRDLSNLIRWACVVYLQAQAKTPQQK
jgi:hypothetical protein